MNFEPQYWWLIAGAAFLALEAFGLSGVGFFFAGFAAIVVGVLVEAGVVGAEAYMAQFAWFFGLTTVTAVILWKPIQRITVGKKSARQNYHNMIGNTGVVVGNDLVKGQQGNVSWSGTTMHAEIHPAETTPVFPIGAQVVIADVQGAKLLIKAK